MWHKSNLEDELIRCTVVKFSNFEDKGNFTIIRGK